MTGSWNKMIVPFAKPEDKDRIIAWADSFGVDSILETPDHLELYCKQEDSESIAQAMAQKLSVSITSIEVVHVPDQNWNAVWESSFKPIRIGDICIRATFHESNDECKEEIVIAPKMAFGTGHHETTYMMIEKMSQLDVTDKTVLDYGCGTGILSIFAAKRNARFVQGIDIQPEAIENSREHVLLNMVDDARLSFFQGDLDILEDEVRYDIILANINRKVLLEKSEHLYMLLSNEGELCISGILKKDEHIVTDIYRKAGFKNTDKKYKGEWCLLCFKKQT